MVNNLSNDLINDDSLFLHEFLRARIPIFVKNMQEVCKNKSGKDQTKCTFEEFCQAIRKFIIPTKYQEDNVLSYVFNHFKSTPEDDKMDYNYLVDKLIDTKDENNFFNFKDVIII